LLASGRPYPPPSLLFSAEPAIIDYPTEFIVPPTYEFYPDGGIPPGLNPPN